jgi:hypothetical protein
VIQPAFVPEGEKDLVCDQLGRLTDDATLSVPH